jgi:hypothetical protein
MKILTRQIFINPYLVNNSNDEVRQLDQYHVVPPAMPNLLQDNIQKRDDDIIDNEVITTSCEDSEPSSHNAPIAPVEHESVDTRF